MLREHVELIRSSLVVADSHSASMRIYRRIQRGTLLRLLAGIYIPRSLLEGRSGLVWFCGPGVLRVVGCYWWCCAHWRAYWLGESQPSALWGCSSL